VRARYSSLSGEAVYLDGPGGTQCPDSVIDAIATYLRVSNANLGWPFDRSIRSQETVDGARKAAARLLGCSPDDCAFGLNMTSLNFALTRACATTMSRGDEVVVTALDHDANVAPWRALERDAGIVVRVADFSSDTGLLDYDHLAELITSRTRVVAFPWASNVIGSIVDVQRVTQMAHSVGAIAWVDAVHYAPHGPIDVNETDVDVLVCSPYKCFGPHLGLFYGKESVLASWDAYKVAPARDAPAAARYETGTQSHEALAGFAAAVEYIDSIGWEAIVSYEQALCAHFFASLPSNVRTYGSREIACRTPTFVMTVDGRGSSDEASRLARRGIAVSVGTFYAPETMRRLGLSDGAIRVGLVHYNTKEEIDNLFAALQES